jgi:hypothetical protein
VEEIEWVDMWGATGNPHSAVVRIVRRPNLLSTRISTCTVPPNHAEVRSREDYKGVGDALRTTMPGAQPMRASACPRQSAP